jgi:UDP-glucose 4-epimerase
VIAMVEKVAGHRLKQKTAGRRAGDPPILIAEATRIRDVLGWKPELDDLEKICATSLAWERKLASGIWAQKRA